MQWMHRQLLISVIKPDQNHPSYPASLLLDPSSVVLCNVSGSKVLYRPAVDHSDGGQSAGHLKGPGDPLLLDQTVWACRLARWRHQVLHDARQLLKQIVVQVLELLLQGRVLLELSGKINCG